MSAYQLRTTHTQERLTVDLERPGIPNFQSWSYPKEEDARENTCLFVRQRLAPEDGRGSSHRLEKGDRHGLGLCIVPLRVRLGDTDSRWKCDWGNEPWERDAEVKYRVCRVGFGGRQLTSLALDSTLTFLS